MFLLSYADEPVMNADRFAWAVCDTIRTSRLGGVGQVLRDWQVVAHAGMRPARLLPHRRVCADPLSGWRSAGAAPPPACCTVRA